MSSTTCLDVHQPVSGSSCQLWPVHGPRRSVSSGQQFAGLPEEDPVEALQVSTGGVDQAVPRRVDPDAGVGDPRPPLPGLELKGKRNE